MDAKVRNPPARGLSKVCCEWLIDPAKVVRTTLQGAASVAGILIMTEATVVEVPGPPPPDLPGHDHHDHHAMDMDF